MTSGYDGYILSETETLTIGSNAQPQSQYPDHPRFIHGATGGFLNNYFITCGGDDSVEYSTNKCYKLGSEGPFATMMEKRHGAASIVLEAGKLWILGGTNEYNGLFSTEYIFSDGRNEEGPPIPIALYGHTIVKINDTTSFLVGGVDENNGWSKRTWYYNMKWIEGPNLQKGRFGHSLGIIRDSVTLHEYVVAAGGYGESDLNDVEVLDIQENKWEQCKLLYL